MTVELGQSKINDNVYENQWNINEKQLIFQLAMLDYHRVLDGTRAPRVTAGLFLGTWKSPPRRLSVCQQPGGFPLGEVESTGGSSFSQNWVTGYQLVYKLTNNIPQQSWVGLGGMVGVENVEKS